MYRTYVQQAIPEKPYPKLDNVALGVSEFIAKPGLRGKTAETLTDMSLIRELEDRGIFNRRESIRPAQGDRAE
jgi:hypothetical protein